MPAINLADLKDIETEKSLLGILIVFPDAIFKCYDKLELSDFYVKSHQLIYETMIELFSRSIPLDILSLSDALQEKSISKIVGGDYYLTQLAELAISDAQISSYIAILKKFNKRRKLWLFVEELRQQILTNQPDELIEWAYHQLSQLQGSASETFVDIGDTIEQIKQNIENAQQGIVSGYKWNMAKLTEKTGGIERKFSYFIGALKKTGKSSFMIDLAYHLWRQKAKIFIFSLEMGDTQIVRWLWARWGEIDRMKLKIGLLNQSEYQQLQKAEKELKDADLFIDTQRSPTIESIRACLWKVTKIFHVDIFMLDYLQRMKIPFHKGENRATAVQQVANELADLCVEFNVAGIILSQLAARAEGHYADISHFKESGGIGEAASATLVLNNVDRIEGNIGNNQTFQTIISLEQRDGPPGQIYTRHDLTISKYEDWKGRINGGDKDE